MAVVGLRYDEPEAGPDVAVDAVGSPAENYQIIKPAFGVAGTAALVEESQPLPARDYHGGTEPFDSGSTLVAAGAPALVGPADDTWLDAILLVNLTNVVQPFQLTDGNDVGYGGRALDPKELRVVPMLGFLLEAGVKIGATNANAIRVQLKGTR